VSEAHLCGMFHPVDTCFLQICCWLCTWLVSSMRRRHVPVEGRTNATKRRVCPECNEPRLDAMTRWRLKIHVMCQQESSPNVYRTHVLDQRTKTTECSLVGVPRQISREKTSRLKQVNSVIVHTCGGRGQGAEIGRRLAAGQRRRTEYEEHGTTNVPCKVRHEER
jgi:hypothetical protein